VYSGRLPVVEDCPKFLAAFDNVVESTLAEDFGDETTGGLVVVRVFVVVVVVVVLVVVVVVVLGAVRVEGTSSELAKQKKHPKI